ncbi:MAG: glycosyltransferase [Acidimicrobiaceae bacterium]|nr:glycosyltransferase [Acidimicrobiaceae bacterium]
MFASVLECSFRPEIDADGNKLVSILIPTFNRERYLGVALASAAAQTYSNIEIVVVDNCSTDQSWEIIVDFTSRFDNLRAYRQNRNHGADFNFITSFELARGYYHKWLMSDDVLSVNCVSVLVQMLEAQPSAILASSSRVPIDEDSKVLPNISATIPLVDSTGYYKGASVIERVLVDGINRIGEPTSALYRVQDVNSEKYFLDKSRLRWIGDLDLWVDMLKRGDLAYVNTPLSFFRMHEGQDQKFASFDAVLPEWLLLIQECWLEGVISWEMAASAVANQISWLASLLRYCDGEEKKRLLPLAGFAFEVYEAACSGRNLTAPLCPPETMRGV